MTEFVPKITNKSENARKHHLARPRCRDHFCTKNLELCAANYAWRVAKSAVPHQRHRTWIGNLPTRSTTRSRYPSRWWRAILETSAMPEMRFNNPWKSVDTITKISRHKNKSVPFLNERRTICADGNFPSLLFPLLFLAGISKAAINRNYPPLSVNRRIRVTFFLVTWSRHRTGKIFGIAKNRRMPEISLLDARAVRKKKRKGMEMRAVAF